MKRILILGGGVGGTLTANLLIKKRCFMSLPLLIHIGLP